MPMTLHEAVEANDLPAVTRLLAAGADPNKANRKTGECPLARAAAAGRLDVARVLLDAGAEPNPRRCVSLPLIEAAGAGHLDVVSLLIERGAAVNRPGEDAEHALDAAAGAGSLEVVRSLLKAGADPTAHDSGGRSAAIIAAEKGHLAIADLLLPLCTAEDRERIQSIRATRAQQLAPDVVRKLHVAAQEGRLGTVQELLDSGVPVDARCGSGMTALMWAANRNRVEVIRHLLAAGADLSLRDNYGQSPFFLATVGEARAAYDLLYPMADERERQKARKAIEFGRLHNPIFADWPLPEIGAKRKRGKGRR